MLIPITDLPQIKQASEPSASFMFGLLMGGMVLYTLGSFLGNYYGYSALKKASDAVKATHPSEELVSLEVDICISDPRKYAPFDEAQVHILQLEGLAAKATKLNLKTAKSDIDQIGLEFAELMPSLEGSRIPQQFISQGLKIERDTLRSYDRITIDTAVRYSDLEVSYAAWIENPNRERLQLIYEDLINLDISIKSALDMKYFYYARD